MRNNVLLANKINSHLINIIISNCVIGSTHSHVSHTKRIENNKQTVNIRFS
jgi:hypothetical protein